MRFLKVKDAAYYYIPIIKYAETQFTICFYQQKLKYSEQSGCTIKYGKKKRALWEKYCFRWMYGNH